MKRWAVWAVGALLVAGLVVFAHWLVPPNDARVVRDRRQAVGVRRQKQLDMARARYIRRPDYETTLSLVDTLCQVREERAVSAAGLDGPDTEEQDWAPVPAELEAALQKLRGLCRKPDQFEHYRVFYLRAYRTPPP